MAALCFNVHAKNKKQKGVFTIEFENYVGDEKLKLDSATYTNELGQTFSVSKFKYYIGNIQLKSSDGKEYNSDKYFLIDEENSNSKKIILENVSEGNFNEISFIIGVDSIHNCSGVQSGALDPLNTMFWTWNTGYIFLKLEGHAASSNLPSHIFEYHIGGYKEPNNALRRITLKPALSTVSNTDSDLQNITIRTDIAQIFKTPTTIDFASLPSVTDFNNAAVIADNYMDAFTIMLNDR